MNLPLESPSKRQKTNLSDHRTSGDTVATSTPYIQRSGAFPLPEATVSAIAPPRRSSSTSTSSSSAQTLKSLQDEQRSLRQRVDNASTSSGDLEDTLGSELDQSAVSATQDLDYDAFFENLGGFRKSGKAWQWFKPLRQDKHIYTQILSDVNNTEELAKEFAYYCKEHADAGLYLLVRFIVDCAGYQNLDIESIPVQKDRFQTLFKKIDSYCKDAEVCKSLKFLFGENDRLSTILQMAIFSFIQKFILSAYESRFLFGCQFTYFMELPALLCESNWINLVYTGAIFNMKILTAICMIKGEIELKRHQVKGAHLKLLDTHIITTYTKVTKLCKSDYLKTAQLKLYYIKELELWMNFSPKVFVDHCQCWKLLVDDLILDSIDKLSSEHVRLAALNLVKKLILDEKCVRYLENDPIEIIAKKVADRFEDISDTILIKALNVYKSISVHYSSTFQNQEEMYQSIIKLIGNVNYEIAKNAGNCLIDLLKLEESDDMELLTTLTRIADNYYPDKKHFFVEALIEDNSKILQDWELFIDYFTNADTATDMSETKTVSDILLEAVRQTLVGKSKKMREKSREVAVLRSAHVRVADHFLVEIKSLLFKYKKEPEIVQNFLKVVMEIDILQLTHQHAQHLNGVLARLLQKLFSYHENVDCLRVIGDFLLHFSKCDHTNNEFEILIKDINKEHAEKFLEGLKKKDEQIIFHQAKKVSVLFERFDLNEHLSWHHCFDCWDRLDDTELKNEFVHYMMQCCRNSLIFKLKKLAYSILPRSVEDKSIKDLISHRTDFIGNCFNILEHTTGDMRRNAWIEVSETYLNWGKTLENISKQKYLLQNTLPTLGNNEYAVKLYFRIFDKHIIACEKLSNSDKQKYAMFVVNMAIFGMVPLLKLDVLFKYYDKLYEIYSQIIEKTINYFKAVEPLIGPVLLFLAIKLSYQDVLQKRGAVGLKYTEAKNILSLTRRLANVNTVKSFAGTILILSIEYVGTSLQYDFFIYVRPFIDSVSVNEKRELLKKTRESIPSDVEHESVVYFVKHLVGTEPDPSPQKKKALSVSKTTPRKERPLNITTTPVGRGRGKVDTPAKGQISPKGTKGKKQLKLTQSTESGSSEMSLHDTSDESDDFTSGVEHLTLDK